MSLISDFIANKLLKALEDEFMTHEPEIQDAIIAELAMTADRIKNWVESKLAAKNSVVPQNPPVAQ